MGNLGHTVMPVKGAARYRVRVSGITIAPPVDEHVRRLVIGQACLWRATAVNTGRSGLRSGVLSLERLNKDGSFERLPVCPYRPDMVIARPGVLPMMMDLEPVARGGTRTIGPLALPVALQTPIGERLWYRIRVAGKMGEGDAEGVAWFTGIAVRPVELAVHPGDPSPQPPGSQQELVVSLRSNLAGDAPVLLRVTSPTLDFGSKWTRVELREGIEHKVPARYTVPAKPTVVPLNLELELRLPSGPDVSDAQHLWLRFTPGKAVVVDLAKLAPVRMGIQFRGKAEEPLTADSGASFRAASSTVGGVEKAGFFCHPPYQGGVGLAFGEFEVALPDEPCAFETLVGFTDGSSTEDGCVFSLQAREPPAGSQPAGGWETVGSLQFAELKRWMPFRADLTKFRGKRVALRLVADVGPADNSHSD